MTDTHPKAFSLCFIPSVHHLFTAAEDMTKSNEFDLNSITALDGFEDHDDANQENNGEVIINL